MLTVMARRAEGVHRGTLPRLDARPQERRSDPRRGVAVRVGLTLAATGIVSAAIDRREIAAGVYDWRNTVAFGLFALLLIVAGFRRPPRGAVEIAFAALAVAFMLAAIELGTAPGMLEYVALALAATFYAAPHLRPLVVGTFALWTPALWLLGGPSLTPLLWVASLVALAAAAFALLDPRRVHPSERLRRSGYAALAIAVAAMNAARTLRISGPGTLALDAIALAAVLTLVLLAYARLRPPTRETAALATALIAFAAVGAVYIASGPYHADAVVGPHRAAQLLLAGEDPYASFDLPEALSHFHIDLAMATHLDSGDVIHTYSYPAVSFLVVAPFVALGLDDIRWIYLLAIVLIAVLAARHLRPAWRPAVLATIVGNEIVSTQALIAGVDPTWALFILCAWLLRDRRWSSAVFLALAIADRQPAWFVFPFFLVAIAQRAGTREAAVRAAIALAIALALHVPFLIGAPQRTIEGIFAPMFAPLVADGVGLMQLGVTARYTPILPRVAYALLALGAFIALLAVVWRRPRTLAGAVLGWALLPLYAAWRSLPNYFTFAPLFTLVADDELGDET